MEWIFTLDGNEIEEPIGFGDIELSLLRDDRYHGIVNEASLSTIEFIGDAADYLLGKYADQGVQTNVVFSASVSCSDGDIQPVLSGRLNFGKLRKNCGQFCSVSLPWEQDSCALVLKARFNQKVDVDKAVGSDGITTLPEYAALAMETDLLGQNLFVATEGMVSTDGDTVTMDIFAASPGTIWIRPVYARAIYESINESYLNPTYFAASSQGPNDDVISPIVLYDDTVPCFNGTFSYASRLKGSVSIEVDFGQNGTIRSVLAYGEFPSSLTIIDSVDIYSGSLDGTVHSFDHNLSGFISLPPGQGIYHYIEMEPAILILGAYSGYVTFDPETAVNISANQLCPPTTADLYAVHETLSRVMEVVTNGCARVKSDYYGRVDSEPFEAVADGCGGLRTLTSGLKIRNAEDAKFFASPQELIEGLNAIDNIGFDVIPDPIREGAAIVRVEDVAFFYQDELLLTHDGIPAADIDVEEAKHYSTINVGYKKWETEKVNGLGEFNSNRQYSTSIDTINSQLDITSNFIAAGIPIELTRQQSFAQSGGADNNLDNDIFILSMVRDAYGVSVERGGVTGAENIYSPDTVLNFRLSPVRNLMRWYKTIASGFASFSSSVNQLFFSSGTGNLTAAGMLTDVNCRLENNIIRENQNIFVTNFQDQTEAHPIWRNELATYEYPMSISEYQQVKENPYGYIRFQCGNGAFQDAFIKEIKYKPAKGVATFILRLKYGI